MPNGAKYGPNNEELPEELKNALRDIVEDCEKEDKFIYQQTLKTCRRNIEIWHGLQYIFWSETANDWRTPNLADLDSLGEENPELYDYVINIYKAHGESVIAALSQQIPPIYFPPDDADNPDDQYTSKTFSKISELIDKHNRIKLLLIRALFILWNEGLICAYNYNKSDKKFGTTTIPKYENQDISLCPQCEGAKVDEATQPSGETCQLCGSPKVKETTPIQTGEEELPKSREILDMFGPSNVKIPTYARTQSDCGYLLLRIEQHFAMLKSIYPHIADKIEPGATDKYDRWSRTPTTFSTANRTEERSDLITVRRCWLRNWQFKRLPKEKDDLIQQLEELYPKGCYVTFIAEEYAESRSENMDDHWTLSESGVSQYIHADPLGQSLISIQEMRNTLGNLGIETLEHGIPETFADSEVLDFDAYGKHESTPGYVYQAKKKPGESLGESFYTLPKSTLSKDYFPLKSELDKDAQFVSGSFPSIYGGPGEGNSRTFSEYNMSRSMALQRLTIAWNILTDLWSRMKDKSVRSYARSMIGDEKFVKKQNGSYLNVWIRRAEMQGKVGDVEPEPSEAFPISSDKKRDILMKLMELNNEYINAALYHPENTKLIAESIAFPDFYIPGSDQRNKQYREIQILVQAAPLDMGGGMDMGSQMPPEAINQGTNGQQPTPDMTGGMNQMGGGVQEQAVSSLPIDPDVDDHAVHIQVLKDYMVSDAGWDCMTTNPHGYANLKAHLNEHMMMLQMQTMGQHERTGPGEQPESAAPQTIE